MSNFVFFVIRLHIVWRGHQLNFAVIIVFVYTLPLFIEDRQFTPLVYSEHQQFSIAGLTLDSITNSIIDAETLSAADLLLKT